MTADMYITEDRQVREQVQDCPVCGRLIKRTPHGAIPPHYGESRSWPPCPAPRLAQRARFAPLVDALLTARCFSCGSPAGIWCVATRSIGWAAIHSARFYAVGLGDLRPRPVLYPFPHAHASALNRTTRGGDIQ